MLRGGQSSWHQPTENSWMQNEIMFVRKALSWNNTVLRILVGDTTMIEPVTKLWVPYWVSLSYSISPENLTWPLWIGSGLTEAAKELPLTKTLLASVFFSEQAQLYIKIYLMLILWTTRGHALKCYFCCSSTDVKQLHCHITVVVTVTGQATVH